MREAAIPEISAAGVRIPKLGLGTWELRGQVCAEIVGAAIDAGYRLIDTAQGYDNEEAVGAGIGRAGVAREELFITTKVHPDRMGAEAMPRSVADSLEKLGTDYVDLLLLHWPNPNTPLVECIAALNAEFTSGRTRAIGLSNFTSKLLEQAWALTEVPFAAEQIEYHPYLDQSVMLDRLRRHEMAIMAYCPIALGRVVTDEMIGEIGAAHGRSAVQVALRWLVQQENVIAIPRTSKPERLAENLDVFTFELSDKEMAQLGNLVEPGFRLVNEPQWVPEWD